MCSFVFALARLACFLPAQGVAGQPPNANKPRPNH
ncbi:hypothetical protein predicted by Glimmer/Critica [Acetobacter ghanensis]|uniref:Uncharacterized protein n=1 Tax=Acetobacter ghanensis TaxID=431306 RepID=A0A0U5F494_9PROT|nr:hypothetical protein predicted by Glimmer/Critica [Acetobacter ghanensis]